jgi:hypothetical protein
VSKWPQNPEYPTLIIQTQRTFPVAPISFAGSLTMNFALIFQPDQQEPLNRLAHLAARGIPKILANPAADTDQTIFESPLIIQVGYDNPDPAFVGEYFISSRFFAGVKAEGQSKIEKWVELLLDENIEEKLQREPGLRKSPYNGMMDYSYKCAEDRRAYQISFWSRS